MSRIRLAQATALALAIAALAPSGAHAMLTTVTLDDHVITVRVTGEMSTDNRNAIVVTQEPSGTIIVSDVGQHFDGIAANGGCSVMTPNSVSCPVTFPSKEILDITTGDGLDAIQVDLPPKEESTVGDRRLFGGGGPDSIVGSFGDDVIDGEGRNGNGTAITDLFGGDDTIVARGGADTVNGGPGNDYLNSGGADTVMEGANKLDGGPGSDVLDVASTLGPDEAIGGGHVTSGPVPSLLETPTGVYAIAAGDVVAYRSRTFTSGGNAGVTVNLNGNADDGASGEGDRVHSNIESIYGSARDDTLSGNNNKNRLEGSTGKDTTLGFGGADEFRLRDGIRDNCPDPGLGDFLDLDLLDPNASTCVPTFPPSTTFSRSPVDETVPPVEIGRRVRTSGGDGIVATIGCHEDASRPCRGTLALQRERGGRRLARSRYRIRAGRTGRITLEPGAAAQRSLRGKLARLTTSGPGTSRRGDSSVIVMRRVPR